MTNRQPTASETRWGIFLASTIALYALVMVIIPAIRFMNGA